LRGNGAAAVIRSWFSWFCATWPKYKPGTDRLDFCPFLPTWVENGGQAMLTELDFVFLDLCLIRANLGRQWVSLDVGLCTPMQTISR
jgi:hypothetical protein